MPALDVGFCEEGESSGVYHSRYDTFEHHSRFVDPGFVYDALLAKTVGRMVLRVAEADLPLQRAGGFADAVSGYLDEVKKLEGRQARGGRDASQAAARPRIPARRRSDQVQRPAHRAATRPAHRVCGARRRGRSAQAQRQGLRRRAGKQRRRSLSGARLAQLQMLMLDIDQTLAPNVGLPGRPWYRNLIYAPGRFTGYGAKTLPGVREAIEDQRWADADRYAKLTADALNAYSDRLDKATAVLKGT